MFAQIFLRMETRRGVGLDVSTEKIATRGRARRKKYAKIIIFFLTLIFRESIPSCDCSIYIADSMSHRKRENRQHGNQKSSQEGTEEGSQENRSKEKEVV